MGCGGGVQVISLLTFYSNDPSSNPAEANSFSVKMCLKRTKINKKRQGVGPFFKKNESPIFIRMGFILSRPKTLQKMKG